MRRVLEKVFRHGFLFVTLLIIPTVIGVGIMYFQPRQYEASATLWALQRYSVVGPTGIEADLTATEASTQATALQELLQTRSFDQTVAQKSGLDASFPSSTRNNPSKLAAAVIQEMTTKVIVTPGSSNLFTITYDNKNPNLAQRVVTEIVDQYGVMATGFSATSAQQLIQTYQSELGAAEKTANDATQSAAAYARIHPFSTQQNDPTYNQLLLQAQNAQANVGNLQNLIITTQQNLATVDALYKVVDAPSVDMQGVSRTKNLLLGGGVGLAVGLLAVTLLLVAFLRRDRSPHSPDDLRRLIEVPVALELPELPAKVLMKTSHALPAPGRPGPRW